jgi:hypothetical protein
MPDKQPKPWVRNEFSIKPCKGEIVLLFHPKRDKLEAQRFALGWY